MRPGSVIIDLAVERGGNVEGAKPGEVVDVERRQDRRPSQRARPARSFRVRALRQKSLRFLEILIDKTTKALAINWDDEIVKATALTRDGAVVHPSFAPKSAA